MEKMPKESNLQVTFSKRRTGFFKKASELSLLCGAEVAAVVFSPAEKVYSFGHPNVESVIGKFMNGIPPAPAGIGQMLAEANRNHAIGALNNEVMELEALVAQEIKNGEEIDLARKQGQLQKWFPPPLEELSLEELTLLQESILNFKEKFVQEAKKSIAESSTQGYPNNGNSYVPAGFSCGVNLEYNHPMPFEFHNLSDGFGRNATNDIGALVPYNAVAEFDSHDFLGGSYGLNRNHVVDPSSGSTSEPRNFTFSEPSEK